MGAGSCLCATRHGVGEIPCPASPHSDRSLSPQLFDHIIECIVDFQMKQKLTGQVLPLGFTFSFPCQQLGLDKVMGQLRPRGVGRVLLWDAAHRGCPARLPTGCAADLDQRLQRLRLRRAGRGSAAAGGCAAQTGGKGLGVCPLSPVWPPCTPLVTPGRAVWVLLRHVSPSPVGSTQR